MISPGRLHNEDASAIIKDSAQVREATRSSLASIADTFERTEDKYLVPCDLYQFVVEQLEQHMLPSYPIPGTHFTFIESRYYDSADLRFLRDHFEKPPLRHKLRLRRYGPNGKWQTDSPHLELKSKQRRISRKERFRMGDEDLRSLAHGYLLAHTESLRTANSEMKENKLGRRIEKVNAILEEIGPQPMCAVRYARRAFEQGGIRVTVDSGIRTEILGHLNLDTVVDVHEGPYWPKMLQMGRRVQHDSHFVMEVKHSGVTLGWLDELVQDCELISPRFSKYCYAMIGFIASSWNALPH